jgi:hypothetical protein
MSHARFSVFTWLLLGCYLSFESDRIECYSDDGVTGRETEDVGCGWMGKRPYIGLFTEHASSSALVFSAPVFSDFSLRSETKVFLCFPKGDKLFVLLRREELSSVYVGFR